MKRELTILGQRAILVALFLSLFVFAAAAQNVLTVNYGNDRTNADLSETQLTTTNVKTSLFGKLFTLAVDGQIYTQPLYQQNLNIAGAIHNVVFVTTLHNSVYAFDGDTPGLPLWKVNLGSSVPSSSYNSPNQPGGGNYTDLSPENGILGTPVIDATTGTLYAVAATLENGSYYYKLHALDTNTGAEKFGGPTVISGQCAGTGDNTNNGMVAFDPPQHIQRPGLLLLNGVVYVAFGSHADTPPYHGWIMGYSASNLQTQTALFNPTVNGRGASIWQSGRGMVTDDQGNIFLATGNGDSDGVNNFGNTVLKLDFTADAVLKDWFAPSNVQLLDDDDADLGASGPTRIPGTNYLIAGGKGGTVYVLDMTSLGHQTIGNTQIPQNFEAFDFGIFNMALWNRSDGPILYLEGANSPISAYKFAGGQFGTKPISTSIFQVTIPFQGMTISANGSQNGTGILWVTTPDKYPLPATGTLRAYDAGNLTTELWDSAMDPADALGMFTKFASPTVTNGKVYVPTISNQLVVYGMKSSASHGPAITAVVNAASYSDAAIAPGQLISIYGLNLGPATLIQGQMTAGGSLSAQLAGTQVTFNGIPAPLIYASQGALAAVVPFEVAGSPTASIQVGSNGLLSPVRGVPVAPTAPAIFALDATGSGQGAIVNQDNTINSPMNPAAAGTVIAVYATGGGQTTPGGTTGLMTTTPPPLISAPVGVTVGGQAAPVMWAGDAPGCIQGVIQVNIQLPASVGGKGSVPIVLTIGGKSSQSAITVAVK